VAPRATRLGAAARPRARHRAARQPDARDPRGARALAP
jgi:hypothetical protein